MGGESFLEKLEKLLGPVVKARRAESFSGGAKARHDELAAEEALARGMKVLGLRQGQLEQLPKAAPEKIALAHKGSKISSSRSTPRERMPRRLTHFLLLSTSLEGSCRHT